MFFLKYLLMSGGIGMILAATGMLTYDLYQELLYRRAVAAAGPRPLPSAPYTRWRGALGLGLLAWGPLLLALGIVVVPSGMAGVRGSETNGTVGGTLHPGVPFVAPLG